MRLPFSRAVRLRALALGLLTTATQCAVAAERPNIVVIVADDLGYHDLGFQGGTDIPTPNLDRLAAGGVRCSNGYVTCPVCSPTRAGLLTGRYQQRFGHEHNPGPRPGPNVGLSLNESTLPQLLRATGYKTAMVGKWHLGFEPKFHPLERGFEQFFGFLGGAHTYLDSRPGDPFPILRGREPVEEQEYLTDAFAREAVAVIDREHDAPFFLYLTFNAVHNPAQATEKYLSRVSTIENPRRRTYAAMLVAMDDAIGRVLDALAAQKLEENTLVFFISDNGGPIDGQGQGGNASNNAPLSGRKGMVAEGGIRVPFVVRWPARLPAGKTYDQPVISLDILPTALAAAGAAGPEGKTLDGVDLVGHLTGEKPGAPHDALFWRFGPGLAAARMGDWKLVHRPGEQPELFNLADDVGESRNRAGDEPQRLAELETALAAWEAQLQPPAWGRLQRNPGNQATRPGRRARRVRAEAK